MKQISIIILLFFSITSCSIYQIRRQSYIVELPSGKTKIGGKMMSKRAIKSDQFNFYNRWDHVKYEYYSDGTLKSKNISHFKSATYGRACNEILYLYVTYDSIGQKTLQIKDVSDCRKSTIKTYEAGKLVSKKVTKRNK